MKWDLQFEHETSITQRQPKSQLNTTYCLIQGRCNILQKKKFNARQTLRDGGDITQREILYMYFVLKWEYGEVHERCWLKAITFAHKLRALSKSKSKNKIRWRVERPGDKRSIKPCMRSGEIWEAMLDLSIELLLTKYNTKMKTHHDVTFQWSSQRA